MSGNSLDPLPATPTKYHHLTMETAPAAAERFIAELPPMDHPVSGRGITICAGGLRYFTCAWVCIRMLRELGCNLPIQLWHLDEKEMTDEMRSLVEPLGVECVDASQVRRFHPVRSLCGWALKPYSIAFSPFREVLALDADNVPIVNPEFLFDIPQFADTGALFWPDYWRFKPGEKVWDIFDVAYFDGPQFESGQIVIDKQRCWEPLRLALWYNENSDFFYRHILGDKDTFQFGFRRLGRSFSMPARPIENLVDTTMCQHDFEGRRIFQHRNQRKWELFGRNDQVPGFRCEQECLSHLDRLRQSWDGRLPGQIRFDPAVAKVQFAAFIDEITSGAWWLYRFQDGQCEIFLRPDGLVSGATSDIQFWDLEKEGERQSLLLSSEKAIVCRLRPDSEGIWRGYLLEDRQVSMIMRRPRLTDRPVLVQAAIEELTTKLWAYRRVGFDQRTMKFEPSGTISQGAGSCEVFWNVGEADGQACLEISSIDQLTCRLFRGRHGQRWRGHWLNHEKMPVHLIPLRLESHNWRAEDATMPGIVTQLVTQQQIESSAYATWCRVLRETPRYHRRQWEYVFVLAAYEEAGWMAGRPRCLGIGEVDGPLPETLSGCGAALVELLSTEEPPDRVHRIKPRPMDGTPGEVGPSATAANDPLVCYLEPQPTERLLAESHRQFDFIWTLGHLSKMATVREAGEFIVNTARALGPGGTSVHLGDFRLSGGSSQGADRGPGLTFTHVDLETLANELRSQGYAIELNLHSGGGCVDEFVDEEPYGEDHHLKLCRQGQVVTSIGIVVARPR